MPDDVPDEPETTTYTPEPLSDPEFARWMAGDTQTFGRPAPVTPADRQVIEVADRPDWPANLEGMQRYAFGQLLARHGASLQLAEHLAAIESERAAKTDRVADGGDFLFNLPDRPASLWGDGDTLLWTTGEALMLVGPQGVGKTTIAGQLVRALLGLMPRVLDMTVTPAEGTVMYWAMDRPQQAQRSIARMFAAHERDQVAGRLKFWQGPPPADFAATPDAILRVADRYGVRVMVVDSLKDAALGLNTDEGGAGYNRARQLLLAEGVELIELHHMTKGARDGGIPNKLTDVYGSGWVTAGAGSVVLVWGNAGDPIVTVKHLKSPLTEMPPMQIQHNRVTGMSTVFHDPDTDLVEYARTAGVNGITIKEAASVLYGTESPSNADKEKARRVIESKISQGLLVPIGGHAGRGRGNAVRWCAAAASWASEGQPQGGSSMGYGGDGWAQDHDDRSHRAA